MVIIWKVSSAFFGINNATIVTVYIIVAHAKPLNRMVFDEEGTIFVNMGCTIAVG